MHGSPYQYAVYVIGLGLFVHSYRRSMSRSLRPPTIALFLLLAAPAFVYAVYYLRVFNEPIWLYQLRAVPGSELLAGPSGLAGGWVAAEVRTRFQIRTLTTGTLYFGMLFLPYLKGWVWPIDPGSFSQRWRGEVCQQTTPSTCGLASAATVMRLHGIAVEELDLAADAYSTQSGTENWYLKRAMEKHGVTVHYHFLPIPLADLPCPSIAGLRLGPGAGHFVAVLRDNGDHYEIGDPMHGRIRVRKKEIASNALQFTGFFMSIQP